MTFIDSKPHYAILDGLRGVAALLVVWYHVFEGFQFAGNKPIIDFINHGYVDRCCLVLAYRYGALG